MSMAIILAILMSIETGGQKNPATAIGDNGKAVGVLQIHKNVVTDVNARYGTHYVWPRDCTSIEKSKDIATKYLTMYGKGKTPEQLSRVWNGGPEGDHVKKDPREEKRLREYQAKFIQRARARGMAK